MRESRSSLDRKPTNAKSRSKWGLQYLKIGRLTKLKIPQKFELRILEDLNQGSAQAVLIEILKIWVPLGTKYRENLKNTRNTGKKISLSTDGYRVPT